MFSSKSWNSFLLKFRAEKFPTFFCRVLRQTSRNDKKNFLLKFSSLNFHHLIEREENFGAKIWNRLKEMLSLCTRKMNPFDPIHSFHLTNWIQNHCMPWREREYEQIYIVFYRYHFPFQLNWVRKVFQSKKWKKKYVKKKNCRIE